MLTIHVEASTLFSESTYEFIDVPAMDLTLEHSLLSISKWESLEHVPFMGTPLNDSQFIKYVECMCLTRNVPKNVFLSLSMDNKDKIRKYIDDPMTATTFSNRANLGGRSHGERITSEYIYYLMVAANVPFECEKWHLNRLTTLLKICSIKSQPDKKMSMKDIHAQNRALNAQRQAKKKR